ncbi:addiction module toxin RelE [Elizabethkingia anophelis]|nr:addiction module toxin RelE [Elizabethkingia anophelis]MDV3543935.1 addiction module toxin RelE [Elizabethkingia anophelis]MDV3954208.1 addiction module toxin RelE [Elizabethkingia anophelis]MDV4010706.1 addiction module toxin RelE [Elizabethkingia anophelis]MYY49989.1 addiction module toxin RelE [Elizabethkingia anophelis]
MESQFIFQMKSRNDHREWEQITIYSKIHFDRITAVHYARSLSKKFYKEVRLT